MKEKHFKNILIILGALLFSMIISLPLRVSASTNYILTNIDDKISADILAKDVVASCKKNGDKNATCKVLKFNGKQSFISLWNSLGDSDLIIILSHGSHITTANIEASEIYELNYNNCKCLWLIGCNTAHSHYENNNIASAFSKVVSGVVIASDGTVTGTYSSFLFSNKAEFSSKKDSAWERQKVNGVNSSQKGWAYIKSEPDYSHQVYIERLDVYIADKKVTTNYMNRYVLTPTILLEWLDVYYGIHPGQGPHPVPNP